MTVRSNIALTLGKVGNDGVPMSVESMDWEGYEPRNRSDVVAGELVQGNVNSYRRTGLRCRRQHRRQRSAWNAPQCQLEKDQSGTGRAVKLNEERVRMIGVAKGDPLHPMRIQTWLHVLEGGDMLRGR